MGLDNFTDLEQARVNAANAIDVGLSTLLLRAARLRVPWSIENPASSVLWCIPCFKPLLNITSFNRYDECAWGSTRLARRSFLSTMNMSGLVASCPGDHARVPSGRMRLPPQPFKYASAAEAAYPKPLCVQVVSIVQKQLNLYPAPTFASGENVSPKHQSNIAVGKQPRGRRMPPLLSEFVAKQMITSPVDPPWNSKACLLHDFHGVPAGGKLLSRVEKLGDHGESQFVCVFGIHRTPIMWIKDAEKLEHPFDRYYSAPDQMLELVFDILMTSPAVVAEARAKKIRLWLNWAKELELDEKALKAGLEPGVRAVLSKKCLLLFKKIALARYQAF